MRAIDGIDGDMIAMPCARGHSEPFCQPAGEGRTTPVIGLHDGNTRLNGAVISPLALDAPDRRVPAVTARVSYRRITGSLEAKRDGAALAPAGHINRADLGFEARTVGGHD